MPIKLIVLGAVFVLPLALTQGGCGSSPEGGGPQNRSTPTGLPGDPEAQGASASSGGDGEQSSVTVRASASAFAAGQDLTFVVENGTTETIYVEDMKTDCSILTLERAADDDWQTVWGCGKEQLPGVVAIAPGASQEVTIRSTSTHLLDGPLAAGTYRGRFSYSLQARPEGDEPLVVHSAGLEIG